MYRLLLHIFIFSLNRPKDLIYAESGNTTIEVTSNFDRHTAAVFTGIPTFVLKNNINTRMIDETFYKRLIY